MSQRRSNIGVPTWIVAAIIFSIIGGVFGYYVGSLQYKAANDVWAIEYGKLEKDYGKLDDKYEELEKENNALRVENELLKEKDELRLQKIDILEKELAEKENELTETKKERDAYKQRLDWVEKEKVDEVDKLNEVIKDLKQKIEALRQKIKELKEKLLPEEFDIRITYPTENKVFKFYEDDEFKIDADDVRGTWDRERPHDRFWILINDEDGQGRWTERFDPQCKIEFEDDGTWHAVSPVYITGTTSLTKEKFRLILVEVSKRGEQYYKDYLEGEDYYGLPWYSGAKIWDEVVVFRQIR